ncbi:TetR/AcrR family transcriptional regulator [Salidesulfovibrio brasiliensis]|uniref:TetR/AcrR family transcriptional regulator n=1 Tax=Salidesulfovibrio brasiliensis TaxID=221711 RepID=UPI0006D0F547|nr:TetR/AcrR family transcriptional regulator [Salidesulfovibrio brasiliensis]
MGKKTKQRILEAGAELVHRKGFNNTGISEILKAADVPKGSFYFYFSSKEAFGLELVEYHRAQFVRAMELLLSDDSIPPLERLKAMFARLRQRLEEGGYTLGCPIGNLSQEMGDLNPEFEKSLASVFRDMAGPAAGVLSQAKDRGDIPVTVDPSAMADFMVNSWQGALVRMKVEKSSRPLELFDTFVFDTLLSV